jgi:hypothetical protein
MKKDKLLLLCSLCTMLFASCHQKSNENWIQLFNGKDLTGWNIKITGHDVNDNYLNTFRVENGVLKCVYEDYANFDDKFGHIYYQKPYSHYRLRVEYRFTGNQTPGGAEWNVRNSGVMLHSQPASSVTKDQTFPVSLEMQMLGGLSDGKERTTANLRTDHCINSTSKTYNGDQWVTVEMLVLGDSLIQHIIDGQVVFEYNKPIVQDDDEGMVKYLNMENDWFAQHRGKPLKSGYIALQAESHPVEFRKVELLDLSGKVRP